MPTIYFPSTDPLPAGHRHWSVSLMARQEGAIGAFEPYHVHHVPAPDREVASHRAREQARKEGLEPSHVYAIFLEPEG